MKTVIAVVVVLVAGFLSGCGGGGDSAEPASCGTMLHPNPCTTVSVADSATATLSAASLVFVSADTTNIALKGTGGAGRQEFSTLIFEVRDASGHVVAGASVSFRFADSDAGTPTTSATTGGLTLTPPSATTGSDGRVTTVISAGTMPTSVRVVASVGSIATLSNVLVISTGVPDQSHFSLAAKTGNCEGGDFDQECSVITATVGDHFGNPVPDGTAVNFTSEGGVIDASCVTGSLPPTGATPGGQTTDSKIGPGSGTCSVVLRSSSPRPADGRVTVLAYALGEETFVDSNGNNVFDAGEPFEDMSPNIFRDDDENGAWTPGEPCIGPSHPACATPGDGRYNGVLRDPGSLSKQTLYVSRQLVVVFSGSTARIDVTPAALSCVAGQSVDVRVGVTDRLGNIMPAGTKIEFNAVAGPDAATLNPASIGVANVPLAVGQPGASTRYTTTVTCPAPLRAAGGKFFVTVTTPNGVVTRASVPLN